MIGDEFIGLRIRVVSSTDSRKIGVEGLVVDETRNLFVVETKTGDKKIPKAECVFEFEKNGEKVKIDGRLLVARPEDRIKKEKHLSRKWRIPWISKGR